MLLLLASAPVRAGETAAEPEAPRTAAVVLDGIELFRLRGISALPAEERARIVSNRIEEAAAESALAPLAVQAVENDDAIDINAGERTLIKLYEADARFEDIQLKTLASTTAQKIRAAIESYRRDRSAEVLRRNAVAAAVATALLALAAALVVLLSRRADAILAERYRRRIEALAAQTHQIVQANQIFAALHGIVRGIRTVVLVALFLVWISVALDHFPWTRPFERRVVGYVMTPLGTLAGGFVGLAPKVIFLVIVAGLTRWALGLIFLFFAALDRGSITLRSFEQEWAWPTHRIVRLLVIGFAVVIAFPYIPGSDSAAFRGVSIFLGIVLSLGSSSLTANILAGYSLIYWRAFRLGDRVKIGDVVGEVTEMRLQVTHIRTPKREEAVVPNSMILASEVLNYSAYARQGGVLLHSTVGIGYEVPWRQVEAMLLMASERTPDLCRDPPPFVLVRALGDFAVTYEINAFCLDAHKMFRLYSVLHRNILDVFNEHGVQIMTPAYEGDPEQPKLVAKEQWFAAPAKRDE